MFPRQERIIGNNRGQRQKWAVVCIAVVLTVGCGLGNTQCCGAESGLGNHDDAQRHFAAVQQLTEQKFYLYWYWRMQAQHASAAAWLAAGEVTKAGFEAEQFFGAALSTEDPVLQTRAWEMKARIAMAAESWEQAEEFLSQAIKILRRSDVPMAAWPVYEAGWNIYRELKQADKAEKYRGKAETAIRSLADSLPAEEPLREIFLSSPRVRRIFSDPTATRARAASSSQSSRTS